MRTFGGPHNFKELLRVENWVRGRVKGLVMMVRVRVRGWELHYVSEYPPKDRRKKDKRV